MYRRLSGLISIGEQVRRVRLGLDLQVMLKRLVVGGCLCRDLFGYGLFGRGGCVQCEASQHVMSQGEPQ
jgi:hypothetical protein